MKRGSNSTRVCDGCRQRLVGWYRHLALALLLIRSCLSRQMRRHSTGEIEAQRRRLEAVPPAATVASSASTVGRTPRCCHSWQAGTVPEPVRMRRRAGWIGGCPAARDTGLLPADRCRPCGAHDRSRTLPDADSRGAAGAGDQDAHAPPPFSLHSWRGTPSATVTVARRRPSLLAVALADDPQRLGQHVAGKAAP